MKRIAVSLASLAVIALLAAGAVAVAQERDRDPIQVDEPTVESVPQSSGFSDDQGNPISVEEHNRIRDEETGLQWGNIAIALVVLALIGGGVVWLVRARRSRGSVAELGGQGPGAT